MRITYRQLRTMLNALTEAQLDCDVTVEDSYEDECYTADFRICGNEHDSLDPDHPVIFFGKYTTSDNRASDKEVHEYIKSWLQP